MRRPPVIGPVLALLVALAPALASACARRKEAPAPPAQTDPSQGAPARSVDPEWLDPKTADQAHAIGAAMGSMAPSAIAGASASAAPNLSPSVSVSPTASASTASASTAIAPSASGSGASASSSPSSSSSSSSSPSSSSSANTSTAGQPPKSREATLAQMIGAWGFSRFDLDDAGTKARWTAVPPDLQKEILKSAPEAWLFVGKDTMVTRLNGVPEKKSTFTVEAESAAFPAGTIVVKTSDEGRKAIRLLDADTMRVEDLDKKDSFVTVFARKKTK